MPTSGIFFGAKKGNFFFIGRKNSLPKPKIWLHDKQLVILFVYLCLCLWLCLWCHQLASYGNHSLYMFSMLSSYFLFKFLHLSRQSRAVLLGKNTWISTHRRPSLCLLTSTTVSLSVHLILFLAPPLMSISLSSFNVFFSTLGADRSYFCTGGNCFFLRRLFFTGCKKSFTYTRI